MEKRVISTELFEEENRTENSLRPKLLSDYIGQAKAKEKLKIYIEAAKARGESPVSYTHLWCRREPE